MESLQNTYSTPQKVNGGVKGGWISTREQHHIWGIDSFICPKGWEKIRNKVEDKTLPLAIYHKR